MGFKLFLYYFEAPPPTMKLGISLGGNHKKMLGFYAFFDIVFRVANQKQISRSNDSFPECENSNSSGIHYTVLVAS
jgi:hypothetical protein